MDAKRMLTEEQINDFTGRLVDHPVDGEPHNRVIGFVITKKQASAMGYPLDVLEALCDQALLVPQLVECLRELMNAELASSSKFGATEIDRIESAMDKARALLERIEEIK